MRQIRCVGLGSAPAFKTHHSEGSPLEPHAATSLAAFLGCRLVVHADVTRTNSLSASSGTYQKFQDAYGPKGLVVIGIGLSMDSLANLKKFARALGVHYKLLMGTMRVQHAFGLKGIPTTLLVDRKGIIRTRVVGFDYPAKLKPKIQALL